MFALSEKSAEKKTKNGRLPIAHYKQKPAGSDLWPVNRCIPKNNTASLIRCDHSEGSYTMRLNTYLCNYKYLEATFCKKYVPAVHNCIIGLEKRNLQLLHLRSIETQLPTFTGQRHQHQTRLLSARHHVAVLRDHQPVPVTITLCRINSTTNQNNCPSVA